MKLTIRDLEKYNYGIYRVLENVTIIDVLTDFNMSIDNLSDFDYSFEEDDMSFANSYTTYELRYLGYNTVYETNNMEDMVTFIQNNYEEIKNQTLNK